MHLEERYDWLIDWLIDLLIVLLFDWIEFYTVSAIFQPCNGGKKDMSLLLIAYFKMITYIYMYKYKTEIKSTEHDWFTEDIALINSHGDKVQLSYRTYRTYRIKNLRYNSHTHRWYYGDRIYSLFYWESCDISYWYNFWIPSAGRTVTKTICRIPFVCRTAVI